MHNKALLLLGLFVGIVAACGKTTPDVVDPFADTPWVEDETQPVPIQFGQKRTDVDLTETKAGAITTLDGMPFGVLSLDESYLNSFTSTTVDGTEALLLLNRKGVKTQRIIDGNTYDVIQFKNGTDDVQYYYPIFSSYNYNFYGYKTTAFASDEPNLTWDATNQTYTIPGIAVGAYDILWAKAVATPFTYETVEYNGFNARFMRKARLRQQAGGAGDGTFYADNLPALAFDHLTAALHFKVKAYDQAAEDSFGTTPPVTIQTLKVAGELVTEATLDVVNGTLTGTASAASEIVLSGDPFKPTTTATEFGEGLFILPTDEALTLTFTLAEPNDRTETVTVDLSTIQPVNGFEAGKSYTFTIVVHSLEDAHVKVTLNGFDLDDGDYNIVVE